MTDNDLTPWARMADRRVWQGGRIEGDRTESSFEFWLADEPDDACTCNLCAFSRSVARRALRQAHGDRKHAAELFDSMMPGRGRKNHEGQG